MEIQPACLGDNDPNADVADLYPPGTTPEARMRQLSALCAFGHTPRLMTGILRQLLIQHFADPTRVANSYLRRYLQKHGAWRAEPGGGIYIEALAKWKPEETEARPALLVKDGDWTWKRVAIGDQYGYDYRSGEEFFGGIWQGSHTVFALGNEGAETQLFSAEVAKLLLYYGPYLCDVMNLQRFVVVGLGALRTLQGDDSTFVVPVDVAYLAAENWKLQPDAPRLKRIVFSADDLLIG